VTTLTAMLVSELAGEPSVSSGT